MQVSSTIIRFRYVVMLLAGLVVADGLITEFLVNSGMAIEGNPILGGFLANGHLMAVKIAGAALSALLLASINLRRPKGAAIISWSFIIFYTGVLYWNLVGMVIHVTDFHLWT
jgi:hypothetical protein